ncbi:MAG: hypothetical protein SGJ00_12115 [bacterium]|nr:hypothetical protein [bacterium]
MKVHFIGILFVLLSFISACGCSGYGGEVYPHTKYSSFILLVDTLDTIRSIKYEVNLDTLYFNKKYAPIIISITIPTCVSVRTDKKTYDLCVQPNVSYAHWEDRNCGEGITEMTLSEPMVKRIIGGTLTIRRREFEPFYTDSKVVVDSLCLK